ncbi:hypothetical protein HK105_202199 [Polyrhizophydium stewartii]|uniref:Uncharacterized protein n=1 Tax=Polyrhizophydium stewartii TaxID=2732419 RepID=A0ABR4NFF9_9FUNG|nr:hypothetical protein HK105_000219 [Polyrhizophydium stewartii]
MYFKSVLLVLTIVASSLVAAGGSTVDASALAVSSSDVAAASAARTGRRAGRGRRGGRRTGRRNRKNRGKGKGNKKNNTTTDAGTATTTDAGSAGTTAAAEATKTAAADTGSSDTGSSGSTTSGSSATSPAFKDIDISRVGGDGNAAIAAAQKVCPSNQSASQAEANRVVAEDAETSFFNAALAKVKGNKAATNAIQCQKLRNKVLKQHCEVVRDTQKGNTASATDHANKRKKNADLVTKLCPTVDTSLFIKP